MRLQMYPLDISDLLSSSDCPGGEMGSRNNRLIAVSAIFRILNFTANKYIHVAFDRTMLDKT